MDDIGDYHSFEMKGETLQDIIREFHTVGNYLNNIGVTFNSCGIN